MAGTLTLTGAMSWVGADDSKVDSEGIEMADQEVTITSERHIKSQLSVTTSEVAIPLGGITTLGWFMAKNLDADNFIEIRIGTGGTKILKIGPGQTVGPLRLGSGITAPYAIADTDTCEMAYVMTGV